MKQEDLDEIVEFFAEDREDYGVARFVVPKLLEHIKSLEKTRVVQLPQKLPTLKAQKVIDDTGNLEKAGRDSNEFRQKCLEMINSDNDLAIIEILPDKGTRAEYALDNIEGVVRLIRGLKASIRDLINLLERHGIEYKEKDDGEETE